MSLGTTAVLCGALAMGAVPLQGWSQSEVHGRRYVPPPATGHIVITVEKGYNEKPLENAAVIFHATKNGKDSGNLEIKTNSQGKAIMDLLETGSHVSVQVIANGYATAARDFDVTDADSLILIKMLKPRAQISVYTEDEGSASTVQPGIQEAEHRVKNTGPQVTTAIVSGTLKDDRGGRIPGGIIRLHPATGTGAEISLATDAEGNFRLERITPGMYDLQMSAPGYGARTRRLVLGAGDNQIYRETLRPAPDADAAGGNPPPQPPGPR